VGDSGRRRDRLPGVGGIADFLPQAEPGQVLVLTEIEADLPVPVFTREREVYRRDRRRSLSDIERLIPGYFALLYVVMFVAAVVTRGG
jgi:hypothetical protein